jgi:exopolysaccharide biosynthesis polyprenyl glycosylphosphotransferase
MLVALSRAYELRFIGVGAEEFRRVLRAGVALMALVTFASYLTGAELGRSYAVELIPAIVVISLVARWGRRTWLHRQWTAGRYLQRTVLVGSASGVRATVGRLDAATNHGMMVVGACLCPDPGSVDDVDSGEVISGDLEDLDTILHTTGAGLVIVLPSALLTGEELRRLTWRLEDRGTELAICSGLTETADARLTIRPVEHWPLLQVSGARLSGPSRVVKGVFDRVSALFGLVLISPLLIGVAVAIRRSDGGSPFFCQTRVGLNGREFRIVKFRTMVVDAEARKAELAVHNESDGALFKMADDPRVTPVGRWLRRYSIDELPQLINVLRGEMSLVGPRPPLPQEVATYGSDMRRRLLVKPGMTGLWQVSGRSRLSWAQTETLDLRYVENWSLGFDLLILWRTARAVLVGAGAY